MPDARWNDPREYGERDGGDDRLRLYDGRDRDSDDPRDSLMHDLDLPRGEGRELVVDRDRVYELNGEDSGTLDEAFLFAQSIDATSYERQRDRLREELTLAQIDHHADAVDEIDVQGILAFAERVLPRASDLWVQASLDYKQRLQQLFFPEGIAYDGIRFNRTAVTAPLFNYLAPCEGVGPSTRCARSGHST